VIVPNIFIVVHSSRSIKIKKRRCQERGKGVWEVRREAKEEGRQSEKEKRRERQRKEGKSGRQRGRG
jgi:hypothetical protein